MPRGVVINFGRWASLPVNPRYGAVVHSFKSRGPSRRGVGPPKGRTGGRGPRKPKAANAGVGAATTAAPGTSLIRCGGRLANATSRWFNMIPRELVPYTL